MSPSHSNSRLILFDMDATLVNLRHWHWQSFRQTLLDVFGVDAAQFRLPGALSGDTQPNGMRTICRLAGLDDEWIESRMPEAVRVLSATMVRVLPDELKAQVLPGAEPLLESLQRGGHALGLVTGTVSRSTQAILSRSGLQRFFPVCACGDQGRQRVDLLRLAVQRAAGVYSPVQLGDGLVVIGDAPRDILAGQALRARTIGVATGAFSVEELAEHAPNVVLPSLQDWQTARDAILQS
jgi:phosphoglycolate phosphatase